MYLCSNLAVISVWDKSGIVDLAQALQQCDLQLVASGGTAKFLKENGLNVRYEEGYSVDPL